MASKNPRMSTSSTQFTFFVSSPDVERIQRVDAGCAPAGTRTRSRGSRSRRWRSAPRPSRAGRSCLPARARRAAAAARRPSGCTPDAPASLGTPRASAVRTRSWRLLLQRLPVVPPRLAVHARRGVPLQREVRRPQAVEVVDVVQERREPHLLIPSCCLTYPLQRTGRAVPALCPGRVLLARVPFGQTPSLHPLRRRLPGVVRRLRRYYGPVRLPVAVHRRRTSLDFPTRPAAPSAAGDHGTLPVLARGVSVHARGL